MPIAHIQCKDSWKQESLEYAEKQIAQSKPLSCVILIPVKPDEPYTIYDGIHRINVLKSQSFTHVFACVSKIPVYTYPPFPLGAPYSKLKQMWLNNYAANTLSIRLNVGNVWILSQSHDIIQFCIIREGTTGTGSPPDCKLKVKVITDDRDDDNIIIDVIGVIFDQDVFHTSGTMKQVPVIILEACRNYALIFPLY